MPRTWEEVVGDFDLRSPVLGVGDIHEPEYQMQIPAQKGMWEVYATVRAESNANDQYLLPTELMARHIFWDNWEPVWETSNVLPINFLAGIWDQEKYTPTLADTRWNRNSVAAASICGSYGAACETRGGHICVMVAHSEGVAVAVKIITNQEEPEAHADIEHTVRE